MSAAVSFLNNKDVIKVIFIKQYIDQHNVSRYLVIPFSFYYLKPKWHWNIEWIGIPIVFFPVHYTLDEYRTVNIAVDTQY